MTPDVLVREEKAQDVAGVRIVNERGFGGTLEAEIVDKLRAGCPGLLSLVAVAGGQVLGHVLFSPVTIKNDGVVIVERVGMALGPMAVLPEHQRQGIGSRLVREGLEMLRTRSCPFVVVVGHPEYYPRFGFEPASRHGVKCQWANVPDDSFMALIMDAAAMRGVSGVAAYRDEFNEVT